MRILAAGGMPDAKRLCPFVISAVGILGRDPAGFSQAFVIFKAEASGKATEGWRGKAGPAGDRTH